MIRIYWRAKVVWNGSLGALLCNRCRVILATGMDHEDVEHYCPGCALKNEIEVRKLREGKW